MEKISLEVEKFFNNLIYNHIEYLSTDKLALYNNINYIINFFINPPREAIIVSSQIMSKRAYRCEISYDQKNNLLFLIGFGISRNPFKAF